MAFYDTFEQLCRKKGVTPTQAGRDNGISQPVVSMWKKRGSIPNGVTIMKLCEYFDTNPAYLMGNEMAKGSGFGGGSGSGAGFEDGTGYGGGDKREPYPAVIFDNPDDAGHGNGEKLPPDVDNGLPQPGFDNSVSTEDYARYKELIRESLSMGGRVSPELQRLAPRILENIRTATPEQLKKIDQIIGIILDTPIDI